MPEDGEGMCKRKLCLSPHAQLGVPQQRRLSNANAGGGMRNTQQRRTNLPDKPIKCAEDALDSFILHNAVKNVGFEVGVLVLSSDCV